MHRRPAPQQPGTFVKGSVHACWLQDVKPSRCVCGETICPVKHSTNITLHHRAGSSPIAPQRRQQCPPPSLGGLLQCAGRHHILEAPLRHLRVQGQFRVSQGFVPAELRFQTSLRV